MSASLSQVVIAAKSGGCSDAGFRPVLAIFATQPSAQPDQEGVNTYAAARVTWRLSLLVKSPSAENRNGRASVGSKNEVVVGVQCAYAACRDFVESRHEKVAAEPRPADLPPGRADVEVRPGRRSSCPIATSTGAQMHAVRLLRVGPIGHCARRGGREPAASGMPPPRHREMWPDGTPRRLPKSNCGVPLARLDV